MKPIKMTLGELEIMLDEQKKIVVNALADKTGSYNTETTEGHYFPLTIDKEKMMQQGMKVPYPQDFNTLKRFINTE